MKLAKITKSQNTVVALTAKAADLQDKAAPQDPQSPAPEMNRPEVP